MKSRKCDDGKEFFSLSVVLKGLEVSVIVRPFKSKRTLSFDKIGNQKLQSNDRVNQPANTAE